MVVPVNTHLQNVYFNLNQKRQSSIRGANFTINQTFQFQWPIECFQNQTNAIVYRQTMTKSHTTY